MVASDRDAPAIVVIDLTKSYGARDAVRGLSFDIAKGEFFGLLGPNGAGKTTTIGMLSGFVHPTGGRIFVAGVAEGPCLREARRKLGLVPQEFAFYPALSAVDNLNFFGRIYGLGGRRLRERVHGVLEVTQLSTRSREPVSRFSNGMKRRLNIAIGLIHEPEILILDEPTVGVDAQSRNAIFEVLEQRNREGMTVIYSTHYMEEAQRLCGRVAIMDEGRVMAMDSPGHLVRTLGDGVLQVGFSAPAPEPILRALEQWGAVRVMNDSRQTIQVETPEPDAVLQRLHGLARENHVSIGNLKLFEANLETVFLRLTGRKLRD
jgi:ABC-2 type transport system ATP-binding protein